MKKLLTIIPVLAISLLGTGCLVAAVGAGVGAVKYGNAKHRDAYATRKVRPPARENPHLRRVGERQGIHHHQVTMPGLYYSSEFIVSDWRGRVHLLNLVRRATFLRRLKHWLSFPDRDTVTLRLGVQIQEVSTATKTATTPADVKKSQQS